VATIDPKYYYLTLILLAACTVIGLIVAFRFQREVEHDLTPPTEKDLLGPLEKAYYSGLMDEAEFQRIRASMERRKGEEIASPPKPSRRPVPPPDPADEGQVPGPDAESEG